MIHTRITVAENNEEVSASEDLFYKELTNETLESQLKEKNKNWESLSQDERIKLMEERRTHLNAKLKESKQEQKETRQEFKKKRKCANKDKRKAPRAS